MKLFIPIKSAIVKRLSIRSRDVGNPRKKWPADATGSSKERSLAGHTPAPDAQPTISTSELYVKIVGTVDRSTNDFHVPKAIIINCTFTRLITTIIIFKTDCAPVFFIFVLIYHECRTVHNIGTVQPQFFTLCLLRLVFLFKIRRRKFGFFNLFLITQKMPVR